MRFIDQFQVILLDMAQTFMFGVDRFAEDEDFAATYHALGGESLSDNIVQRSIRVIIEQMLADYGQWDTGRPFPSVRRYLQTLPEAQEWTPHEIALLEQTFALHEVGTIPVSHGEVLRQLRRTHRLGVISDIFAPSDVFLHEYRRAGVCDLFEVILFSSEHGYIKPSPIPFQKARLALQVDSSQIVFVGDSLERDIDGAKGEGFATVWISANQRRLGEGGIQPDEVVRDLSELLWDS